MVIWEIKVLPTAFLGRGYTFLFDFKPTANDLLISLALTEDGMPDCPVRQLLRAVRYSLPADLDIIENGTTRQDTFVIKSATRFVFTKVDTEAESRIQDIPGERQPDGSEGMPKVFYSDGFREQVLAQKRIGHAEP